MPTGSRSTSTSKIDAKKARADLGRFLRGFVKNPVVVSRIFVSKVRSDPMRVAQAAAEAMPAPLRPLVGRVAWPVARYVKVTTRKVVRRMADGPLEKAKDLFDQGRMSEAIKVLRPHQRWPFIRRRIAYYEGEMAALGPNPIPPQPKVTVADRVPGRVLHLVTNALPYTQAGYTVRTHRIVTAQRAAGLDPHVVTSWGWPMLQGHTDAAPYEDIDGIPYHRLLPKGEVPSESRGRMILGAAEVTELVKTLRPQVLHAATDHRNGSVALAVRERTNTPFVYEVRGFLEETWVSRDPRRVGSERHRMQREREAQIMREADAVVTLAETMAAEIVERGVPRERIYLAPNAVDDSLLTAEFDGAALRRRYGIGDDEIVVGSVSSIVAYEGFATLLDAAALLREAGTPVRVLLVGDGAERPALLEQVERLGLKDLAILPGRVAPDEALQAQAALDIFVCPREDLRVCRLVTPLKPVEAMALGKPVVLSDLPALAELVGSGEAGVLVPPGDASALARAIAELRDDPARRREMGEAGKAEVAAKRTWSSLAKTYQNIYRTVTDGR
ncbi:MAG: glycosyltransferase [Thermobispora bispora]|uniref:Glycosyl transferase group 1 n=2 Tax=Thermobispora bispora TaxID=2006 RepID=D6Y2T2_THEBD|nr:glycosyltransferase family 4 protein [Thermobispora bispora]ADG86893.1 glycosyl transferase group 1 [Thermobispora bispora DSM 43833]MBO2475109.1 glycosyltransferase WbuB [Actinomycetales bacterium]MBX6166133.1 glycosyltransferase [Thermobispora bispora]QSI49600.1 glycosyltransferase [Thermobispora bispora]